MWHRVAAVSLLIAAAIHVLPVAGLAGAEQLQRLYGVPVDSAELSILLRHRAVLFGVLGGFLGFAARRPRTAMPVILAGLISTASFLLIAFAERPYGESIAVVVRADCVALVALVVASIAVRKLSVAASRG